MFVTMPQDVVDVRQGESSRKYVGKHRETQYIDFNELVSNFETLCSVHVGNKWCCSAVAKSRLQKLISEFLLIFLGREFW